MEMLKQALRKIIKGQKGQVLPIVLILLAIGGLLIVPSLRHVSASLKTHQVTETKTMELYSADSGVEDAIYWLIGGREAEGPWDGWDDTAGYGERDFYYLNGRRVDVTVERKPELGANIYRVTSTATSPNGSTTVLSLIWAITWFKGDHQFDNQDPPPEGDIHVEGDVSFSGNIAFAGNLTCSGNVTTMNNGIITGRIAAFGDVIMANNSEIHGTLCSGGDITLGNGCVITGEIRLWNDATISIVESGAYIEGNIWADGNLTLDIQHGSEARIELLGDVYAPSGDISIYLRSPNSQIQGDIYASGIIQILDDMGEPIDPAYIHEYYTGDPPFPEPDCPEVPADPAQIKNYEIT
jgi:cytoskeletal protein CcmA (bactofilin family)